MIDPLRRASTRLRIVKSCEDCLTSGTLRYVGITDDGAHHKFRCLDCQGDVYFDNASHYLGSNSASVVEVRRDVVMHVNPVTDIEPPSVA